MQRLLLILLILSCVACGQTVVNKATVKNATVAARTNSYNGGPWISNVAVAPSSTAATVTFKTDIAGSTQMSYGVDPGYGTTTSETDTSPRVTSHTVSISGLSACSTYHFKLFSKNSSLVQGSTSDLTIYTTGCDGLSNPVPAACYPYNPNNYIHIKSASDISTVRQNAINDIWRVSHVLPTRQPDTVNTNIGTTYTYLDTTGMTNISNIDKIGIDVGSVPFHEEAILIKPTSSNGKLAIVHQGHCEPGPIADNMIDIGVGPMIKSLSNAGFYVLAYRMPGATGNTPSFGSGATISCTSEHNSYPQYESSTFNPLEILIEPVIVGINYAVTNYGPFSQVTMVGISGGGWTTVLASAIDSRINISFPVSGSFPNGIANEPNACTPTTLPEGDYEQGLGTTGMNFPLHFWRNVMSYEDAYIMASSQGRQQVQLLRQSDPCCWGGPRYGTYASTINNLALYLGGAGFTVSNDMTSTTHEIDTAQITEIMHDLGY